MAFATALEEFFAYLSAERGASDKTIAAYRLDLEQFAEFLEIKHLALGTVTLSHLREFVARMRKNSLSQRTIARKVSALRQFFRFCLRESTISSNPSELLTVLVKNKRLPKWLTIDEVARLLRAPDTSTETGIRDRAIFEIWYATGCRISEISGIDGAQIDWKVRQVTIRGKGGRVRTLPLHQEAVDWLQRYRMLRHHWLQRSGTAEAAAFFLNQRGKRLERQGLWKLVKFYAEKAGISKRVWPHMIRHSFATHVLQGGADIRAVQELLGHRSIATTEIYTHLETENLREMQAKFHPRG
jgi:integrase/recombinase XerD